MATMPFRLFEASFGAACVGTSVAFSALLPADFSPGEELPLVLHLHGAFSTSASLDRARPIYDALAADGSFPRAMVACATTPTRGGFYIDRPGAHWETVIAEELPAYLRAHYAPGADQALVGASMGGYGALKLVCAAPDRYVAAAALSPAVLPGAGPLDVPERNLIGVLAELHLAMAGSENDPDVWVANSVPGRAARHRAELRASAPRILIDCGAADEFRLADGAAYLHDRLAGMGIGHEYRLVPGVGHRDEAFDDRMAEALRFVGDALIAVGAPRFR